MRPRRIAPFLTVAIALGLGACGGEALTTDEYVKQADAICRELNVEGSRPPQPKAIGDVAALADDAEPLLRNEIRQLRELKAPEAVEQQAGEAYDLLDEQVAKIGEIKDAAQERDEKRLDAIAVDAGRLATQARIKAKGIGFEVCGAT